MSDQHKEKQAENSLDALQHAVDQAESHPSAEKVDEAENAVAHAEIAVRQAGNDGSLSQQLNEEKEELGGVHE